MIKVQDLRIGNVVSKGVITSFPMGTTHSEWEVTCDWVDYKVCDLTPIRLTEDILLKCGFKKEGPEHQFYFLGKFVINVFNGTAYRLNIDRSFQFKSFKYLHQLQNLYYALTNEELNVQL